jgi:flotillin
MFDMGLWVLPITAFIVLIVSTVVFLASRYKRCPSDMILVVYGKVGEGQSARCIHGGGALVWPLIQDSAYLSLTPMTISIPLQNALSLQNIRINVPSTFTVGISVDSNIMNNAAERLLNLEPQRIEDMAKEIIFGQLRLTVASLTIEQINQDRESFLEAIRKNVEPELNKIGLYLINVNITDITDESDYIQSIGKKAAAEAINRARVDVADQEKLGAIGQAVANRDKEIKVAENTAEAEKGKKRADADRRVFVQQQETAASVGEAEANREKEIRIAENVAQSEKGKKKAEADRRVYVQGQEAEAVSGENKAKADIAAANAELAMRQAEALQKGEVARREAEAEKTRREAKGVADGILLKYEAEAKGVRQVLESKAAGYQNLVKSCNGDARAVATLLMTEKIEQIVAMQVEAIKNIKIDKVTVWDAGGNGSGASSTSNFLSSLVRCIPPLQDVAKMAGVELPSYLGAITEKEEGGTGAKGKAN